MVKRSKEKFTPINQGFYIVYWTDHLNNVRMDRLPPGINLGKITRWYNYIDDGTAAISALAGRANPIADALSRALAPDTHEVSAAATTLSEGRESWSRGRTRAR